MFLRNIGLERVNTISFVRPTSRQKRAGMQFRMCRQDPTVIESVDCSGLFDKLKCVVSGWLRGTCYDSNH
jgi:hypothetical protein